MNNDIVEIIYQLAYEYKLDYLEAHITSKGNLILYDNEEKRTLRNSKNELLHNKKAIDWLVNEAIYFINDDAKDILYSLL